MLSRRSMMGRLMMVGALAAGAGPLAARSERILLQSTTSTQNSGLYDHLLPTFTAATGLRVDVVAVGTGQAIRNAEMGDADVLLVHAKPAEEAFVAAGFGIERRDVMYNDFVLIGPEGDPAGVAASKTLAGALQRLSAGAAPFVSRGDDSGTHLRERALWSGAAIEPAGAWYREAGSGMGATLRMAVEMGGYTISDRATWLAFGAKAAHRIVYEGDAALFNQYGVIPVNPAVHGHVNSAGASAFVAWITGAEGQAAIAAYRVAGQQLFFPNAA